MSKNFFYIKSYDIFCCIIRDDVMTWKRFPYYWPFVMGIHRQPRALMFLMSACGNGWTYRRVAWRLCNTTVTIIIFCAEKYGAQG